MWGERPVRGELKSSEEEEEEQEAEREAGGGGEGQAEAVSGAMTWKRNVPLQKGAPKRERSGGTLRAPSSWERGGVGWGGGGNHPDVGKTPGTEGETAS